MELQNDLSGLLLIDKPSGITSHDVVNRIRRAYGIKRVGHAGTLDPPATGVLLVGLGRSTRLLTFLHRLAKTYRAAAKFGTTTSTQDAEGAVVDTRPCAFDRGELESVAQRFVGEISQLPPMVSAIKVRGEPLYRAARRGEEVARAPRKIRIYSLDLEAFDPSEWIAVLKVECSTGTYIRTLAADIGEVLGCGAHITELRRLRIGSFEEAQAISLDEIESAPPDDRGQFVMTPAQGMRDFPSIMIDDSQIDDVMHGRPLPATEAARHNELPVLNKSRMGDLAPHEAGMTAGIPVCVISQDGRLLGVYRRTRDGLRPQVVMVTA